VPAASLEFFANGRRVLLTPIYDLKENAVYQIKVGTNVADLYGNPLSSPFAASFTTGDSRSSGTRIIGNFQDMGVDEDGDSLFEALDIFVDVEVLQTGNYNLNGQLLESNGRLIGWTTLEDYTVNLGPGSYRLKLRYESSAIRNSGLNGPYTLDSLVFYLTGNPAIADIIFDAFDTFPYDVALFFSVLNFGPIQDKIFKVDEPSYPVINLRELTSHASEPIESITYSLRINTSPLLQVSIGSAGVLSFTPQAGTEIESEITIEARDTLGNRADARFTVSFQYPRAARLAADFLASMLVSSSQMLSFDVFDQFDEPYLGSTTVTLRASDGVASPTSITTSSGSLDATFTAGATPGPVFVTATAIETGVEIVLTINILGTPPPSNSPTDLPTGDVGTKATCNFFLAILQFLLGWFLGWLGINLCPS